MHRLPHRFRGAALRAAGGGANRQRQVDRRSPRLVSAGSRHLLRPAVRPAHRETPRQPLRAPSMPSLLRFSQSVGSWTFRAVRAVRAIRGLRCLEVLSRPVADLAVLGRLGNEARVKAWIRRIERVDVPIDGPMQIVDDAVNERPAHTRPLVQVQLVPGPR